MLQDSALQSEKEPLVCIWAPTDTVDVVHLSSILIWDNGVMFGLSCKRKVND